MPDRIQSWVVVAWYRDDHVTSTEVVGLSVTKIKEQHVGLGVNDDITFQ